MANINNPEIAQEIKGYVDESNESLIAKTVLGGQSVSLFGLQTGVKGATAINLLDTEVTLQSALDCGFTPEGSNKISRRILDPVYLKVNMQWCDKNFLDTYAQHMVKIAAGMKTLPYAEDFTNGIVARVNEALETMLYQGVANSTKTEFDGLMTKVAADVKTTLNPNGTIKVDTSASTLSAWDKLLAVYNAVPEVAHKEDLVILVAPSLYRAFVQELVKANMYHYDANDASASVKLPGTNVSVIPVEGLIPNKANKGKEFILGLRKSNVIYGTDMTNDQEKFDFWYSKDDQVFKLAIEFTAGVEYAFPEEIVWADSTPVQNS